MTSRLGPDALALAQHNAQYRVDTSTRIVLALHKIMRDFCACQDKVSGSTPLHTVLLFIAVALSRYAISLMRNVDCPSSFTQLSKANQGFNPISYEPFTALTRPLTNAMGSYRDGLVPQKYKKFCTKSRKFCASLFWDLYPLCAVRCAVQVRAHLGLSLSYLCSVEMSRVVASR